jgi:hypothetical protein
MWPQQADGVSGILSAPQNAQPRVFSSLLVSVYSAGSLSISHNHNLVGPMLTHLDYIGNIYPGPSKSTFIDPSTYEKFRIIARRVSGMAVLILWGSGRSAATEMYWVAAGEVVLFDASGAKASRAVVGDLLGAADLFKPPNRAAAWAWAAASSDDDEGSPGQPENVGPFRARTARVISKRTDHSLMPGLCISYACLILLSLLIGPN